MDFELPKEITAKLAELDAFIEAEIKPLERENMQFFDHRRENARTDWEQRRASARGMARADRRDGAPRRPARGICATACPNPAAVRQPPTWRSRRSASISPAKGLGLHNDLQDESSIVGNFPIIPALADYGTPEQKTYIEGIITGKKHLSFGLTEPGHGSDATWLETTGRARRRLCGYQRPQALEQPGRARTRKFGLRAHVRQSRRGQGHHGLHRADRLRPATTSSTITGRSTCRATTPRSS